MKNLIFTFVFLTLAGLSNAQWTQMNGTSNWYVNDIAVSGSYIFAVTGNRELPSTTGIVYRSSDNGNNWTNVFSLSNYQMSSIVVSGSNIFIAGDGDNLKSNIYLSTNNGTNWNLIAVPNVKGDASLKMYGSTLYAVVNRYGIYKSVNNGSTWTPVWENDLHLFDMAVSGSNLLVCGYGLYLSANNGATWDTIMPSNQDMESIETNGTNVYLSSMSGIYKSSNNGYNWNTVLPVPYVQTIYSNSNNIFAGSVAGFFRSSNGGVNWSIRNEGLTDVNLIWTIFSDANYAYIGIRGINMADTTFFPKGIWKRPYSEVIGIQSIGSEIPSAYSLSQNYPNPFNPTTKIRFTIPILSSPHVSGGDLVRLVVYDVMGREVQTLVNESLQPGTYETSFNGSNLSSGVYFYKMSAVNFSETKRFTLIK